MHPGWSVRGEKYRLGANQRISRAQAVSITPYYTGRPVRTSLKENLVAHWEYWSKTEPSAHRAGHSMMESAAGSNM